MFGPGAVLLLPMLLSCLLPLEVVDGHAPPPPQTPLRSAEALLVFVDARRDHVDGAEPLEGAAAAVEEMVWLRRWARARQIPIVHVVHAGTDAPAIVAPLTPHDDEQVIVMDPDDRLDEAILEALQRRGRTQLLVAGFVRDRCLTSITLGAQERGHDAIVVGSATAARTRARKAAALAGLSTRGVHVVANPRALATAVRTAGAG